jgi:hypothetical protein
MLRSEPEFVPAFAALHRRSGGLACCCTEAINRAMVS